MNWKLGVRISEPKVANETIFTVAGDVTRGPATRRDLMAKAELEGRFSWAPPWVDLMGNGGPWGISSILASHVLRETAARILGRGVAAFRRSFEEPVEFSALLERVHSGLGLPMSWGQMDSARREATMLLPWAEVEAAALALVMSGDLLPEVGT